jgi:hypothetical protein
MGNLTRLQTARGRDPALHGMTVAQIAAAAKKVGMSYGQYVAYAHEYGMRPEKKS